MAWKGVHLTTPRGHAVGTRPSIPPPSSTGRNRAPGAKDPRTLRLSQPYRGEIGREATAVAEMLSHPRPAYHGEIGREATAHQHLRLGFRNPTIGESGREATAGNRLSSRGFLVIALKPRRPGHSKARTLAKWSPRSR